MTQERNAKEPRNTNIYYCLRKKKMLKIIFKEAT